ncbi:MAG: hypothetical protein PHP95_15760 [Desulfuromonadaceae bacterium]|nr:hypothetical protein [Desulfuromonadaceae bacterium]MDD2849908.1 hypothetical protein [Desulfuromonadaceae bacterium]MDD4131734.1 hypothetical protein [Desulfuromonadaceae bacterium]
MIIFLRGKIEKIAADLPRKTALAWQHFYRIRYRVLVWKSRHGLIAGLAGVGVIIFASAVLAPHLQRALQPYLAEKDSLGNIRSLFLNIGSALVGASAIAFSLVVFAMQINVERMPHGLFRRLSSDRIILLSFIGTFLIAISIATLSLIPSVPWAGRAIIGASWGVILLFSLFLTAYKRALQLINPLQQLRLVVKKSGQEMKAWDCRARRDAPLLKEPESIKDDDVTYDIPRAVFFQANQHWTEGAHQAVQYAISFYRRYAERGDHEVSGAALNAIVAINRYYVRTKGKTFFSTNALLGDHSLTNDGFINNTLEHLRQNVSIAVTRRDEQQIEQSLRAIMLLVDVYLDIDYGGRHDSKTHALLAAGYLSDAVKSIIPHNMPDMLMIGARLIGNVAALFLNRGRVNDISTLADSLGLVACAGVATGKYPVCFAAIEQLALLTINLIKTTTQDIRYVIRKVKQNVTMAVKLLLNVPDTSPGSMHSTYLAPYYSCISEEALQSLLSQLVNAISDAEKNHETARKIVKNIEVWADKIYDTEKEILLLAVQKRSGFTFDIINWITFVTKMLFAVSNADSCPDYLQEKLRRHATWLFHTLTWIPDDKETVVFVECYQMTVVLFEAVLEAHSRECPDIASDFQAILVKWAFKAGKYSTGWAILERSIYCLSAITLTFEEPGSIDNLKISITKSLSEEKGLDKEILDGAARKIREKAETFYPSEFELGAIDRQLGEVDQKKLKQLLVELANILSPDTKDVKLKRSFF